MFELERTCVDGLGCGITAVHRSVYMCGKNHGSRHVICIRVCMGGVWAELCYQYCYACNCDLLFHKMQEVVF